MNANDPVSKDKLVGVAKAFIEEHRPEWKKSLTLPPKVEDKGNYWEVSFELPASALGGTPVVEIDKATLKATKAYHTQ